MHVRENELHPFLAACHSESKGKLEFSTSGRARHMIAVLTRGIGGSTCFVTPFCNHHIPFLLSFMQPVMKIVLPNRNIGQ